MKNITPPNSHKTSWSHEESDLVDGFDSSIKFALEEAIAPLFSFDEPKRKFCIEDFMDEFEGEYFELPLELQDHDSISFKIFIKRLRYQSTYNPAFVRIR